MGFTILELVVASAILVILMSGLLMILQQGELASGVGAAKVDLDAEVKMLTEWIAKDVRQAKIQNLADNNNTPGAGHLKFNSLIWNNATNNLTYSGSYIEYSYDSSNKTLLRGYNNTITTVSNTFFNITLPPFYTSYTNETINNFVANDLLTQRSLIVVIKKDKTVRGRPLNFTLVEKVKVRNE